MKRILLEHRQLLLLLAVALTARLVVAVTFNPPMFQDDLDYHALGLSLATEQGYQLEGKPTAYRTPGYPLFLATVYALLGESTIAVRTVQAWIDTLSCLLVFLIGRILFSQSTGRIAAWIAALFPIQILYVAQQMTETVFTFLLLVVVWLLVDVRFSSKRWVFLLTGVLLGCASLIRPVILLLPVPVLLARNFFRGFNSSKFNSLLVLALGSAVIVSPWLSRNVRTFERFSLASNTGVNFWIGNNPRANGSFSFPKSDNPLLSIENDFERSDRGVKLALEFIREQPAQWLMIEVKKFAHFFAFDYWLAMTLQYKPEWKNYPNAATVYSEFSAWSVLLIQLTFVGLLFCACAGWVFARAGDRQSVRTLVWVILYWLSVHLVFFATARYRFPMHVLMAVLAGYGIELLRTSLLNVTRTRTILFAALILLFAAGWTAEVWTVLSKTLPTPTP